MQRTMSWILVGVLSAGLSAGCSRDRTVVRRETSTYVSDDDGFGPDRTVERRTTTRLSSDADPDTTIEERRTTKTVEVREDDDAPRGVLSTTVHFLGEIIALPFRLVGGLIRAIF
jgi:hypothetical protein